MVILALFSHLDIILKAHQQSFFQSSIRSILCYILDVYCSLLNITIDSSLSCMSSVVPLHSLDLARRLSPLSSSDGAVNCSTYSTYNPCSASSGQVSTAVYHVNDWGSEDSQSSSQKTMKHRKISSEEKSFGWDNMLVCIIQFFQGIMEVDEKNGEIRMEE